MEDQNAEQVSSLRLSVLVCVMGALGGITCVSVKVRTSSPALTYQLSLLSSSQGEPLPLPAALRHLRRISCGRRPVIHAERHQLPPPPDALPLQRKASSSRARALGPGPRPEPAGAGGGVKTYPLFPLVHPGSTLAKAFPVLFFPFARRDGCGERKKGGPFASCVREGKENPEEGGPGTAVGSVQPGLPLVGCVWNRGLLPDVPPQSSGPHQHTSSSAPGLALRPSSWNELDFFLSFQEL